MADALTWLLAIELLGILALPLCFVLFQRLPDRGITLAKPLALVLLSYVLWVAGLTHLIPNHRITVLVILVLAAAISLLVLRRWASQVKTFLRQEWRTLAVAEVVFLAFFFLWLAIVSEVPAINHTEKPMDFAFLNAVLQSRFFPPEDPWLSGHSISYYYFGHFIMAFLAKLSAVPSNVGYNLALVTVPALLAAGCFGLLYNLVRLSGGGRRSATGFGLAAPALIILIGNLEGALEFISVQGWGGDGFWDWVGIKGLEGGAAGTVGIPDQPWWWWRASRVIDTLADGRSLDYTITEFPAFSFLLGDLHPHVLSLPFLVLGLSLGLNLFLSEEALGPRWLRRHLPEAFVVALGVGAVAFINLWDLPMIAGVLLALVLFKCYGDTGGDLHSATLKAAAVLVPVLAVSILMFLPFYGSLGGQTSGVLPLHDVSTRPFLFFVAIGLFIVLTWAFVLRQLSGITRPSREDAPVAGLVAAITLAPLVVWVVIVLFLKLAFEDAGGALGQIGTRIAWLLPALAIIAVAAFSAAQRLRLGKETALAFPLVLVSVGLYLLAGAELFYVVDSFGGAFRRMNTVFKVYYQAWLLLGLAGVYGIYSVTRGYRRAHGQWSVPSGQWGSTPLCSAHPEQLPTPAHPERSRRDHRPLGTMIRWAAISGGLMVGLLIIASAYYPVAAVLDRTGLLREDYSLHNNTLDGLAFLKSEHGRARDPGEYDAIRWLRDEAPPGRIVEAVGDDYSDYGRISASTGRPTILGWKGHELQWRGGSKLLAGREAAVALIYESEDPEEVRRLLQTYGIRYVYLGLRERRDYGGHHLGNFPDLLRTVFESDSVLIYEVIDGG